MLRYVVTESGFRSSIGTEERDIVCIWTRTEMEVFMGLGLGRKGGGTMVGSRSVVVVDLLGCRIYQTKGGVGRCQIRSSLLGHLRVSDYSEETTFEGSPRSGTRFHFRCHHRTLDRDNGRRESSGLYGGVSSRRSMDQKKRQRVCMVLVKLKRETFREGRRWVC